MKQEVLKTVNVSKAFGNQRAVDAVNMHIHKGDIYGLVGRNGAGKTTIMNMITTLSTIDEGSIYVFGQDVSKQNKIQHRMGSMIEHPAFFPNLSAKDNLMYYCKVRGIVDYSKIDQVLQRVGLSDVGKKKYRQYSMGMRQRLGIALAILNSPDFIILDEPINGLDPLGISEIRNIILSLQEENVTILLSSHILSELYLVANRFGIIEEGKMVMEVTKEELDANCSRSLLLKVTDTKKASVVLEQQLKTSNYKVLDDKQIRLYEYLETPEVVTKAILENEIGLLGIQETGISLEEYFTSIVTGGEYHG